MRKKIILKNKDYPDIDFIKIKDIISVESINGELIIELEML